MQQILQNLVTNAIHYTPAGGSIHVVCRAEGETACVSVQDTGCGIAPEDQSAVFDRYFHTYRRQKARLHRPRPDYRAGAGPPPPRRDHIAK
ncbi:MAG: ATP-binding protein [Faecalibacterium prausnitzii]